MSNGKAHIELLGKTVKDRVTEFLGTVTSVAFDLYGCVQAVVTPPVDKDGKTRDGHWFDVNRLEIVNEKRRMPVPEFDKTVPKFGATPQSHKHGPTEKPAGKRG